MGRYSYLMKPNSQGLSGTTRYQAGRVHSDYGSGGWGFESLRACCTKALEKGPIGPSDNSTGFVDSQSDSQGRFTSPRPVAKTSHP